MILVVPPSNLEYSVILPSTGRTESTTELGGSSATNTTMRQGVTWLAQKQSDIKCTTPLLHVGHSTALH